MSTFVPRAVDDSGFVIGTDLVSPMGALCDETSPDSVDEGDAGLVRMTADRKLLTRVVGSTDSSRLEVDSSGRVTVAAISTSVTPGTAAANLGKAEDAAHTSGDVGVMALAVRRDVDATFGADGDYSPIQVNQFGQVVVATSSNRLDVTASTAIATQDSTILDMVRSEDQASGSGDKGFLALVVRKDTPSNTSTTDGDYETLQVSAGRLWTSTVLTASSAAIGKLAANSGVDIGDVDVTSVVPGTGAADLGKAEDGAHTSGDVGVMALAVTKDSQTGESPVAFGDQGDYTPIVVNQYGKLITAYTYNEDSNHASQSAGAFILGVRNDSAGDLTDNSGDYSPIAVHSSGAVAIAGFDADTSGELQRIAVDASGALIISTINNSLTISGGVDIKGYNNVDTFSATGSGALLNSPGSLKYHSLQVVNAGSVTVWDVRLEGSNDNANFTQIIQHTNVDLTGTTKQSGSSPAVYSYFRTRCAGYTGSGNLIAYRQSVT